MKFTRPETPSPGHLFSSPSINRSIFTMGFPSMIGFLTLNVYTLVDVFWMGKLGEGYVAAITLFEGIYFLFFAVNEMVDIGAVAVISRHYGERKPELTRTAVKHGFLLKLFLALLFGLLGTIFIKPLLHLIGAEADIIRPAVVYGRIMLIALCFRFALESVYTILRSIEAPLTAMFIMIGGMVLNLILDPVFIFGWGLLPPLGIAGAATASVISFTVASVIGVWLVFTGPLSAKIKPGEKTPIRLLDLWRITKIGLPVAAIYLSYSIAEFIVISLVADFGTKVVAAYGMGIRIIYMGVLSIDGLGRGISPLIGNLLGAGIRDRAWKIAHRAQIFSVLVMVFFAVLIIGFAFPISRIFFTDPETMLFGVQVLRIIALSLPFFGLLLITDSVFRGGGNNIPSMVISLLSLWGLQIPAMILLTHVENCDQTALWWTLTIAVILETFALYYWFSRGNWTKKSL